jgi:hypothetical protein
VQQSYWYHLAKKLLQLDKAITETLMAAVHHVMGALSENNLPPEGIHVLLKYNYASVKAVSLQI